jgi:hypothetical protein
MSKDLIRQIVNIMAVVLALTVNVLAVLLPLNGQDTGEISDRLPTYFTPAGYVFSIWSVIFIGWTAFAILQALPARREYPPFQKIGYLFALSHVANAAWLFCWHYNYFGLSALVMLTLLGLLIATYRAYNYSRARVKGVEKWAVDRMLSVYLGWISVATIANIATWLYSIQWDGFGIAPQVWAVIMIVVATLLAAWMTFPRKDSAFVAVFAWAFAGIAIKQAGTPLVAGVAWVAAALAVGMVIYSLVLRSKF